MSVFKSVQGIVEAEKILSGDTLMFSISKNEVDLIAIYRLEEQILELKKRGSKSKNSLALSFMGYDHDPREVYMIPEIRNYLRTLFEKVPELFYFINIQSYTFAILMNAIFINKEEVDRADAAILDYAKSISDNEEVITISYYAEHHDELVKRE